MEIRIGQEKSLVRPLVPGHFVYICGASLIHWDFLDQIRTLG